MKNLSIVLGVLLVMLVGLNLSAQAQERVSPIAATCFTVPTNGPFAAPAQAWMRTQQERGAKDFIVSGTTICAY